MVDEEVSHKVVLSNGGETVVVTNDAEGSDDNRESGIRDEDLAALTGVEDEGGRVKVWRSKWESVDMCRISQGTGRTVSPLGVEVLSGRVVDEVRRPSKELECRGLVKDRRARGEEVRTCWIKMW